MQAFHVNRHGTKAYEGWAKELQVNLCVQNHWTYEETIQRTGNVAKTVAGVSLENQRPGPEPGIARRYGTKNC